MDPVTGGDVQNVPDGDKCTAGLFASNSQNVIDLAVLETVMQPFILRNKAFFCCLDDMTVNDIDLIFLQTHNVHLPIR